MNKENQIGELAKQVRLHNQRYFIDNNAEIPDEDFDKLVEKLRQLDPNNEALFEIVGEVGTSKHPTPMLSIDKKYKYEEIKKWLIDTKDKTYIVEPKYDGMAARYTNGKLATRGDGITGEDITPRLQDLNIIGKLPNGNESIYGEIIIPLSYFNKNLKNAYKNPRNAVVGIIKSKRPKPEGIKALQDKGVHFVIYDMAKSRKVTIDSLLDKDEWALILEETLQTDYPLDGIVIKAESKQIRENLNSTEHHEKWQIAYKLPAERKWSKVVNIKDQVGRTGRITSVAVIDPVELSGATVTNVTLHNAEFVESSKIRIGSKVQLCRSGEVIPFIIEVRNHDFGAIATKSYKIPSNCPICKTKLIKQGKYLQCPNSNCPARTSKSIEYFFKTLNVENLGLKTIEKFMDIFDISSPIDFYNLQKEEIAIIDGFGAKSAKAITSSISSTLNSSITETQLLQALGISIIGPATSRWIVNHFGFDTLPSLNQSDIENIKGIGPEKAKSFISEIKNKWFIIESLKSKGLKFKQENKSNKLAGLSFCITGKKGKYSRDQLVNIILQNGGEYSPTVTKNLSYLIAGENAGSKLEKANTLSIKVITEKELPEMIG
ncbi:hypothetical protein CO178_00300 [candidate division WWE3 bacterium CG_4_9_14_3_um_filter_34_6]|uniref:DNA ligase n=1 Tax=candidate division WWE3 bacterium CG_4_9_14_3_um_filter_34_6 TaxID=1975079 RepID=A0A2M7X5F8_UNCKA|nr:MAG: hypothetical protein CO178_00300 [candidate division WWE3 bacterium CG_4_9_14_3_um_filter_34_6]